jgi:SAM-dependent methyltransferase
VTTRGGKGLQRRPISILPHEPPFDRELMEALGVLGLHVGCGPNLRGDWLNADQRPLTDEQGNATEPDRLARLGGMLYLEHDATRRFPFPDGTFDWVFSEHFIEHIDLDEAIAWLGEMRRILRPGGLIRITTPDLRRYLAGYEDPEAAFFTEHRNRISNAPRFAETGVPDRPAWMVNQIFRGGHRWIYDFDELRHAAVSAGFAPEEVVERRYQEGRVAEVCDLDREWRSHESLYVEITRSSG